jgi:hypothetical protein
MKNDLLAALLELLRGRTGKWDVVKDAAHREQRNAHWRQGAGRRADGASHRSDVPAAGQERSRGNRSIIACWLPAGRSYFAWHAG